MTRHISVLFFLLLLAAGALMSAIYMPPLQNFTEKTYNEALPVAAPSRNFWGAAEYALFGEGRKGVVVGKNGWLYTAEEFSCPRGWQTNLAQHLAYINEVRRQVAGKGVALRILVVPAKARVVEQFALPSCRQVLYQIARQASGDVADLAQQLGYMHADTHWSPAGARKAAEALAKQAPELPHMSFTSTPLPSQAYRGDLLRYLPGVAWPAEELERYSVSSATSLLDDATPPVVLVGTSYSAKPEWGFDDALRLALQADVLNKADEGQGPFAVMEKYLNSADWQSTPPKLLIWEIPERYLVLSP